MTKQRIAVFVMLSCRFYPVFPCIIRALFVPLPLSIIKNERMKNIFYLGAVMMALLCAACSSQKKNEKDAMKVLMQDSAEVSGPQRMQVSDAKETISFKGKEYHSSVVRRSDESLPVVVNEQGEKFVDNRITLRITCGNRQVVDKVFTKESFASLVDARFLKHAVLEGLVFDKTAPGGLIYAASICYPQTDLYIPLRLTISTDGKISITRDELLEDVYETDSVR